MGASVGTRGRPSAGFRLYASPNRSACPSDDIRAALASLPDNRTPSHRDWHRLSTAWRPRIDAQIAMLERLRDRLDGCIGCGCLSLKFCRLLNPDDSAGERGPGPRYVIDSD